jgi:hypothetical protein
MGQSLAETFVIRTLAVLGIPQNILALFMILREKSGSTPYSRQLKHIVRLGPHEILNALGPFHQGI